MNMIKRIKQWWFLLWHDHEVDPKTEKTEFMHHMLFNCPVVIKTGICKHCGKEMRDGKLIR